MSQLLVKGAYELRTLTCKLKLFILHHISLEEFQISFQNPNPKDNLILFKNLKINSQEGIIWE